MLFNKKYRLVHAVYGQLPRSSTKNSGRVRRSLRKWPTLIGTSSTVIKSLFTQLITSFYSLQTYRNYRLVYTEAALREVQRLRNVAPFALPHCAMKETQLYGYTIPKVIF